MANKETDKWEKAVIFLLNLDGWDLKWTGGGGCVYDAKGKTPKGKTCVLEIKFRKKHYDEGMIIEKKKYDALMALDEEVKLYFNNTPKGNFMYYLNTLKLPKLNVKELGATTHYSNKKRINKDVYYLKDSDAVIININIEPHQLLNVLFIIQINVYCVILILKQTEWNRTIMLK